jgi:hypothetical protein
LKLIMKRKKGIVIAVMLGLFMIFSVMSVSAKWYEIGEIKEKLNGLFNTNKPVNITVNMLNSAPQVIAIWQPVCVAGCSAAEEGAPQTVARFNVTVYDENGYNEVEVGASVVGNFTNNQNGISASENTRVFSSCVYNGVSYTTQKTANWTCSVAMQYWDIPTATGIGSKWNISVQVTDIKGDSGTNMSNATYALPAGSLPLSQFAYGANANVKTFSNSISWMVSMTDTNKSAQNLLNVTNGGNVPITGGTVPYTSYIQVTAYNLSSDVNPGVDQMWSESFSADNYTRVITCNPLSLYQILNANVAMNITEANYSRRPAGQFNASIQFCLKQVKPGAIGSATYFANVSSGSNIVGRSWEIGTYY